MLQIVQRTLSITDGDEVTTISETVESEQVAELVKTVYDDIMSEFPWYHRRSTVALEVTATANEMRIPNEVDRLLSDIIYYGDKEVHWILPENMLYLLKNRDTTLSAVDSNGAMNDVDPTYWSSLDDENIIFDSYDGSLVSSSTAVWAASVPTTPTNDTDVPDMPHGLHIALLYGVFSMAFSSQKGDLGSSGMYDTKKIKKIAKAKNYARRTGKDKLPGQNVNYGRRNINISNERSSSSIIEGT